LWKVEAGNGLRLQMTMLVNGSLEMQIPREQCRRHDHLQSESGCGSSTGLKYVLPCSFKIPSMVEDPKLF
jgi:hypothetical protein